MKKLLLIFITCSLFFSIYPHFDDLRQAIIKSDVIAVKKILSLPNSLTYKKIQYLDMAQEIINKRRDDIWLADIAKGVFSAKENQLRGIIIAAIGGLSFIVQIIDYKDWENSLLPHSLLGTAFGCLIFKLSHDYLANLDKQYQNAMAIKQLIYEAKTS